MQLFYFKDRADAANQLVEELTHHIGTDGIVLAIPRGGVPLGRVIADSLGMPLDIILTKKISHPEHKEYAIGAMGLDGKLLLDHDDIAPEYLERESERVMRLLREQQERFCSERPPQELNGKKVIIVDDGLATGLTMRATLDLVHLQKPSYMVVAVPVASTYAVDMLKKVPFIDEVICLHSLNRFGAVGKYYQDFGQVTDEEVKELIAVVSNRK